MTIKVQRSERLQGCYAEGGPEGVSVNYDIPIPVTANTPFTKAKEIRFDIPPSENERFTVTVGPDGQDRDVNPWFGVINVVLHHIDGQDIELGPFAVIDTGQNGNFAPSGTSWLIAPPTDRVCMRRNANVVDEVMAVPGIIASKEFAALHHALRPYH